MTFTRRETPGGSLLSGVRSFTGTQRALLGSGFLVNLISFSVYPYLAILLRDRMSLSMGQVGVVLGLATFVQFAGGVPGAALAERIGFQRCLLISMVPQTLGSLGFVVGGAWPAVTIAALFLRSAATALYSPSVRGYTVHGASETERPRLVAASYATGNVGVALGPVVGSLFIHEPGGMFVAATVLHALMMVGHVFLPRESRDEHEVVEPLRRALRGLAVLPFAVTALTLYLHMHFYQYLSSYAEDRVATVFYGAAMMGYSLVLAVLQPLIADRVEQMRYTKAMALGFGGLAVGMIAFTGGNEVAFAVGILAIGAGNSVLLLKNVLEALARSKRSPAVVFSHQRLAEGIGAFLSGLVGGGLYYRFETAGQLPGFWVAVAAQCVLIPPALLLVHRRFRSPQRERTGS
ncbi:MFS transporter [Streptomyces parvus]|uniref:MFS transporter n=1 Tax=Streptomyces parvus TaxID=66428 RepID=UPI00123C37B0|nr:MFS transporter [Streptomyces parvus]KAA6202158.1 MFS transporter [Streptomyces parvus]GGS61971.1 MFS transporter [Streptomyces parvus]